MSQSAWIRHGALLCVLMYLAVQSLGMHFHRIEGSHGDHAHTHAHGGDHGVIPFSYELPQRRGHDHGSPHATDIDSAATADASVSQFKSPFVPLFLFAVLFVLIIPLRQFKLPLRWPRVLVPQRPRLYFLHPPSHAPPGRHLNA